LGLFRRKSRLDPALVGCWHLVRAEAELDAGENVDMAFRPDGTLQYSIDAGEKWQIIRLTYHVAQGQLVTDQPSAPREERTPYAFDADGLLILGPPGERSWYRRGLARAPAF
jgi:hypothetical protein